MTISGVSVLLIAIFFITSADSGSLVIDTITAGGKMDAPVRQRVFWCVLAGMASLQALTISIALPFAVVMLLMCIGLFNGLRAEST